jgi:hypothetical protein
VDDLWNLEKVYNGRVEGIDLGLDWKMGLLVVEKAVRRNRLSEVLNMVTWKGCSPFGSV